jgi:hypothetical protein
MHICKELMTGFCRTFKFFWSDEFEMHSISAREPKYGHTLNWHSPSLAETQPEPSAGLTIL